MNEIIDRLEESDPRRQIFQQLGEFTEEMDSELLRQIDKYF